MRRISWWAIWGLLVAGCGESGASRLDAAGDSPTGDARTDRLAPDGGSAQQDGGSETGAAPLVRDRHPGDQGMDSDPAVIFHDDFESGWGRWSSPKADTAYLHVEQGATAHAGQSYLRSTVTRADLAATQYISAAPRFAFPTRVDHVFWRFHVRFPVVAPNPHHWVRVAAGTPSFNASGLANTVPDGNQGFWFDFDANLDNLFNFYVYWYAMRSGRCNDGSTTPGCAGDQGVTYHYGNVFRPTGQDAFPRDRWFCVEIEAQANTVGSHDGRLAFWIDDQPVGAYGPGYPDGTWLRDSFNQDGCTFSACTPPVPFEGFDFRKNADVRFKEIFLDAYYERDSSESKWTELAARGLTTSNEQTILYDDVVVATERIGCRK